MSAIWVHLHLLADHIPMLWAVFAFALYYYGTIKKNCDIQEAALLGFAVTSAITWFVLRSGEHAARYVPGLPLISLDYLYEHEQWAKKSVLAIYAAGAVAFAGAVKLWLRRPLHGLFFIVFSVAAASAISLAAITSDIGAKVANPAVRPQSAITKSTQYERYKYQREKGNTPPSDKTPVANVIPPRPADNATPAMPVTQAN